MRFIFNHILFLSCFFGLSLVLTPQPNLSPLYTMSRGQYFFEVIWISLSHDIWTTDHDLEKS